MVCVNKFSVNPSSPYSYSEMGSKIFYRCFEVDDVGVSPQANPSRPPRGQKLLYPTPARALRREGRPVRPCREAHSLSPCPDGQRQRLRTRKPDPIARVLHPRSDNTRCCPADSSWACPPGSRRIDVYSYKVPARPEAKSALQGRGTGLARWWGHEVLKGPNTLAGVRSHFPGIQQRKLQTLRPCSYPYTPLLSAGPAKYRLSPMPPPPSLRMVPRPSQGGLWDRSYHQFSTAAKYPMGLLLGP